MSNPRKTPPGDRLIKFSPTRVLEILASRKYPYEKWGAVITGASMILAEPPHSDRFHDPVFEVTSPTEPEFRALRKEFSALLRDYLQGKDVDKIARRAEKYGTFSTRIGQVKPTELKEGFVPLTNLGHEHERRVSGVWVRHKFSNARNLFYRMLYLAITSDNTFSKLGVCKSCGEISWYRTYKGRGDTCPQCYERLRNQDPSRKEMKKRSSKKWRKEEREYRKTLRSTKDQ